MHVCENVCERQRVRGRMCERVCEECMSDCGARTQSKEGHFVNNALGNRDRVSREKGTGAFYLRDTLFHGLFLGVISCLL